LNEFIFFSDGKIERKIPTKVFNDVSGIKPLLSANGWRIFQLIARKPSYPAEIAKKLNMHEQKVYYYVKQLKASGLIELSRTEERLGATAKFYSAKYDSISLLPFKDAGEKKEFSVSRRKEKQIDFGVREFFEPFIYRGKFNAKIIVGSPDPHGQFKARARDAHLSAEISALIGSIASEVKFPFIFLDTDIQSIASENSNLIIIGGLLTNKLTEQINPQLKCRFESLGSHWIIKSKISGNEYSEDSIGLIEKIAHPNYKDKRILVLAGNRNAGTKAAVIALTKKIMECIKPNFFDKESNAKIIEGIDSDSDGIIDEIEFKE